MGEAERERVGRGKKGKEEVVKKGREREVQRVVRGKGRENGEQTSSGNRGLCQVAQEEFF